MKNKISKIGSMIALGICSLAGTKDCQAQLAPSNLYVNQSLKSRYVGSRGFTGSEGAVAQTDAGITFGPVSYDCWINTDLKRQKVTELDNILNVPFAIGKYNLNAGAIHFTSPSKDWKDALEIGLGVSRALDDSKNPVKLSAFAGHLFAQGAPSGEVYNIGLSKSFPISKDVSLNLDGKVWYNNHYWAAGSDFSHAALKASVDVNLGKGWSLDAFVLGQKAIDSFGGTFNNRLVGGVGFTKKF